MAAPIFGFALGTLALLLGAAGEARACGAALLARFVADVQELKAGADAQGPTLLRCPTERDPAAQWLAFHYAMTGDKARAAGVDPAPAQKARGQDRASLMNEARAGRFEDLLAKVEAQEHGFASSPETQLVLARVLARKGRFDRAQRAYVEYLRLNPDDGAAEAEYLYTFIWSGDHATAEDKLASAQTYSLSPELAAAVKRGRTLLQKLRLSSPDASGSGATGSALIDGTRATLAARLSTATLTDTFRRQSLGVAYQGPLAVEVAAYSLTSNVLDEAVSRPGTVHIGRDLRLDHFTIESRLGYFSEGDGEFVGRSLARIGAPGIGSFALGIAREPLALMTPLAEPDLGTMRDTVFFELGYEQIVTLTSELRKEAEYASHERHRLAVKWPLGAGLALLTPIGLERHPRPSPLYASDARTLGTGVGLGYEQAFAGELALQAALVYERQTIDHHGGGKSRPGLMSLDATAVKSFAHAWAWRLKGSVHRGESDEQLEAQQKMTVLEAGVEYRDLP